MTGKPIPIQQTEPTEAGDQMLVSGVRPVAVRDRLVAMAAHPMLPKRNPNVLQKPCDLGLFDEAARNQIDLIDFLNSTR